MRADDFHIGLPTELWPQKPRVLPLLPEDFTNPTPAWSGNQALITRTNNTGSTIPAGSPVRITTGGQMVLAQANSFTNRAHGITLEAVATGASGAVCLWGPVTRSDWTPITSSAALTEGSGYWLVQTTAGLLGLSAPTGSGDLVQRMGLAVTNTTLWVIQEIVGIA